jgi:D-amino-acid dehydrogenase
LSPAALAELEPALRNVEAAVLYPDACHVSDPAVLAADLLRLALERGAAHVAAQALRIEPNDSAVHIQTDGGGSEVVADRVVVSAGIWSRSLAAQLGDRIPLDTERGYNATYPKGTFGIGRPIMFEGEGFVTSPLDTGDRVGGAVEFAGLEAPPNHGRTDAMVQRLTRFLPHLKSEAPAKRWMGFRPSIPDSLPVIGPAGKDRRVIYAFGHGHFGLTQSAITACMVAALIEGQTGPVDVKPFSAQRF